VLSSGTWRHHVEQSGHRKERLAACTKLTAIQSMASRDDAGGTAVFISAQSDIEMVSAPGRPGDRVYEYRQWRCNQVADGIHFSNGIMLNPDRKEFYCNDTFVGTWP